MFCFWLFVRVLAFFCPFVSFHGHLALSVYPFDRGPSYTYHSFQKWHRFYPFISSIIFVISVEFLRKSGNKHRSFIARVDNAVSLVSQEEFLRYSDVEMQNKSSEDTNPNSIRLLLVVTLHCRTVSEITHRKASSIVLGSRQTINVNLPIKFLFLVLVKPLLPGIAYYLMRNNHCMFSPAYWEALCPF